MSSLPPHSALLTHPTVHLRSRPSLHRWLLFRTKRHPRQENTKGASSITPLYMRPHHLQHINRINVSLFTPALLFSKVAFSLSPGATFDHPSLSSLTIFSLRKTTRVMDHPHRLRRHLRLLHARSLPLWHPLSPKKITKVCAHRFTLFSSALD